MSDVDYSADVSSEPVAAPPDTSGEAAPASGSDPSLQGSEAASPDDLLKQVWKESQEGTGPFRDEFGRYARREIDQAQAAAQEQAPPAIQAPQFWSAEAQAAFASLPPQVQEELARRDMETQQFISRQGNEIGYYRDFADRWEHGREAFEARGWTDQQAFDIACDYFNHYLNDPIGAIVRATQEDGIDLYQALGVTPQHGISPDLAALYAQNGEFQRRLDNIQRQAEQQERAENDARLRQLENQVVEFSRDKPDFEQISPALLPAIEFIRNQYPDASPNEWLEWAYDAARWAIPESREQMIAEHNKAQEKARVAEAQQRARAARNGQALNVASSPANMSNTKSPEDLMRETFRRMNPT